MHAQREQDNMFKMNVVIIYDGNNEVLEINGNLCTHYYHELEKMLPSARLYCRIHTVKL